MKKSFAIVVVLTLAAACAVAQQVTTFTLRVHIPFDFVVRGDTMPAGDYTVQIPAQRPGPMMIGQSAGKKAEFVIQVPLSETWTGRAQLTFHQLGGSYYLIKVSDPRVGVQRVQQGERYKNARKLASAQTVVIAAK